MSNVVFALSDPHLNEQIRSTVDVVGRNFPRHHIHGVATPSLTRAVAEEQRARDTRESRQGLEKIEDLCRIEMSVS